VKRSSFLNIIAVILILILIVSSVMFIGSSREWFRTKDDEYLIVTASAEGSASVIRRGAGYSLKEGIGLAEGDGISTASGSFAEFDIKGQGNLTLDETSELKLTECSDEGISLDLLFGAFYFDADKPGKDLSISTSSVTVIPGDGSMFSIEVLSGAHTARVYKGSLKIQSPYLDEDIDLRPGDQVVAVEDEDGIYSFTEVTRIVPQTMSTFLINRSLEEAGICFSKDELNGELKRRAQEVETARIEREEYEKEIIARGGTVKVIEKVFDPARDSSDADIHTCTIQIRCDTILNNMGELTPGKNIYVPSDGIILAVSHVAFTDGETVYDVLKRACNYVGIPIEYSWTVAFGGYYIEGINNLYEFDCGPQSGWMYKVNGWFPNYGSSVYKLKDGDDIVWAYTCKGIGADIGAIYTE